VLLRKPALCLLVALAAPVLAPMAAHADGPPQPVPADGQCAVPADPGWTRQEQFVWRNVCAGKEADFNKEPDYGGDLDPKGPAGLLDSRILRSSFLEAILLRDKYRNALTRLGVRIIGARFAETVDLRSARLQHELWLVKCLLEKGANLTFVETSSRIIFDESKILGLFNAAASQIDKDLSANQADFFGSISLLRAHIGNVLDLDGATVMGTLNMNEIRVGHAVVMRNKAQLNDVELTSANISINLELIGSVVGGELNMNGIHTGQNLLLRGTRFKAIDLSNAHVGGQVDLSASIVDETLEMNGTGIDQALLMRQAQLKEIDLRAAHIGELVDLGGSNVTGTLDMNGIRIGLSLVADNKAKFKDINLVGANIGVQILLDDATVTGKLESGNISVDGLVFLGGGAKFADEIDLRSAKIGQELVLSNGTFDKGVELNAAHIGGALWLYSVQWPKSASLDLTNATAGAIDLSQSWPDTLYANGLSYRGLSNLSQYDSQKAEVWLGKQSYASQPYEQLAGVLQANGLTDEATDIRYAGRERERREATGLNWVWLVLLNYSIGFGYHLEYAFAWALGFVLLGWAVLYATGQRTKHGMTLGLTYSFDMLLPLVQLNKKHDDVDLDPWPQRYFYAHKLIGVLLTSFIVAGISGLTK
jgi:hypothetical protein